MKKRVFHRTLQRSYLGIAIFLFTAFLVFFTAFYFVYHKTARQLTDSAIDSSTQALSLSAQYVADDFSREWNLLCGSTFITDIHTVVDSLQEAEKSSNYADLLMLRKELQTRFSRQDLFRNVSVLLLTDSRDYFCSMRFISDNFARDYGAGLFCFNELDYPSFRTLISSSTDHRYIRQNINTGLLRYTFDQGYSGNVCFYIYRSGDPGKGSVICALLEMDLDVLRSRMTGFHYAGSYYALSDTRSTVFTTDPDIRLTPNEDGTWSDSETDTIYLVTPLSSMGLSVTVSLDPDIIFAGIRNFHSLLLRLTWIFFGIVLLTAGLLFLEWHYPVLQIARKIPGETGARPESRIHAHITSLEQDNAVQLQQIEALQPTVRTVLFSRLYSGSNLSESDRAALFSQTELRENTFFRCVCTGALSGPSRAEDPQILHAVREYLPAAAAVLFFNGFHVCLVPISAPDLTAKLEAFLAHLNSSGEETFAVGLSSPVQIPDGISAAFEQARAALENAMIWQNASVVDISQFSLTGVQYNVGYDRLEALYGALCSGNARNALEIFDALSGSDPEDSAPSDARLQFVQQLYQEIRGVLMRLSGRYDTAGLLEDMNISRRHMPLAEQIRLMRSSIEKCAALPPLHSANDELSTRIHTYCSAHFCDPNLSLSSVADEFGLSESSLSRFFKDHSGINFSSYIENLRIRQAEKLLIARELSVREVAAAVGYVNPTTFYNAFRRNHGCTPTQWIEQILG